MKIRKTVRLLVVGNKADSKTYIVRFRFKEERYDT